MTGKRSTPHSVAPDTDGLTTNESSKLESSKPCSARRGLNAKVVTRKLADGSIKQYRYARNPERAVLPDPTSLQALMVAYRRSPEFADLRPNSQRQYNRYHRHLEDAWHRPLSSFTRRFLLEMRDVVATGYGPAAGNCFVQATSALFAWAIERGWLEYNPIARAKRLKGGKFPAWSMPQVVIALNSFPEALRRALILGLHTGQRRSDLIAMTWGDYNGSVIDVQQIKTGEPLTIPVHRDLRAELERWRNQPLAGANVLPHPTAPILTTTQGLRWSGTYLSMCFAAEVRKAGLPDKLNVHGLRKLAAANLAEAGCDLLQIASITGHRSLGMLKLYTESAQQRVLATAAIRRLEGSET